MEKIQTKIIRIKNDNETLGQAEERLGKELADFMSLHSGDILLNNGINMNDDFLIIFYASRE